jgi:starch phosphorylase
MRESMARLTPRYSANRTVREYTEQHYLPAAAAYRARAADDGAVARRMFDWRRHLERHWDALRFGEVAVQTRAGHHHVEVQVALDGLDPDALRVELYADPVADGRPMREEMKPLHGPRDGDGWHVYCASLSAARPASDYTARMIPRCDGLAIPLEASRIRWQR